MAECHLLAEVAANAQLIAAAPDLYEALKHFADMYDVTGDPVAYYQNATLRNQVRAAIAKAEGRGS